jgi:hypothetical protein
MEVDGKRKRGKRERGKYRVKFFIKFGVVKEASRISYHEWQQSNKSKK